MLVSLTKNVAIATFALGLALASPVVTCADAAMRHGGGGGSHGRSGSFHGGGIQRGTYQGGGYGGHGSAYRSHGGGYGGGGYGGGGYGGYGGGYGDYGYGYGYGCPQFPIGLITGYC
jgi:hypothetical protein